MPLKQRVPKLKGFNNPFRVEYSPVNLDQVAALGESSTIGPEVLVEASGLVRKGTFVKILARGEITTKIDVTAHGRVEGCAGGHRGRRWHRHHACRCPTSPAVRRCKGNQFTNR